MNGCFDIGKTAEVDPDGRAASRWLWPRSEAQIGDRFLRFRQVRGEPFTVSMRLHFRQLTVAHWAGDVARQQLPQRFVFENFSAGFHICAGQKPGGGPEGSAPHPLFASAESLLD